jgi:hypothetical protein
VFTTCVALCCSLRFVLFHRAHRAGVDPGRVSLLQVSLRSGLSAQCFHLKISFLCGTASSARVSPARDPSSSIFSAGKSWPISRSILYSLGDPGPRLAQRRFAWSFWPASEGATAFHSLVSRCSSPARSEGPLSFSCPSYLLGGVVPLVHHQL